MKLGGCHFQKLIIKRKCGLSLQLQADEVHRTWIIIVISLGFSVE